METEAEQVKVYSSYTEAQKRATKKYREQNKEKVNAQRKKYYDDRKAKDPNFLQYKRDKAKEYYIKKKGTKDTLDLPDEKTEWPEVKFENPEPMKDEEHGITSSEDEEIPKIEELKIEEPKTPKAKKPRTKKEKKEKENIKPEDLEELAKILIFKEPENEEPKAEEPKAPFQSPKPKKRKNKNT